MPLYEYQCDACGHRFEVIQKYSDAPIMACPACGGAVTKLLSSPAIQFKGSGFYLTDYGRGTGKADSGSAESSGGAAKKGESTGESKAESKGESTGESSAGSKSESSDAKAAKKADAPSGASSMKSGGSGSTTD